ncbi:MAG: AIR synthase related protein, partial [Pseudomonadota bacterium]
DLDFAIVGKTIAEDRFLIVRNGEVKADLPLATLSGSAPEYDRPWVETPAPAPLANAPACDNPAADLLKLLKSPNYCSRRWVWEQYDNTVMADTVRRPGADAAVVRVHGTEKALAFTSDVTPRYCRANPERGGAQAVAEAYRNLSATGAKPLATTDNMNFGNPEKPEIMGQFVGCIKGIGAAVAALDMPIVSGNVSLYNETDGAAILPTPTIGAVGLLASLDEVIGTAPAPGDALILIGETKGHLGQSAWLSEVHAREDGDAPAVDLDAERQAGELVRALHAAGLLTAAHDLGDGGLAVAAAEMALAAGVGVSIAADETLPDAEWFFGEDQARYLLAVPAGSASAALGQAAEASVPARRIGEANGDHIALGRAATTLIAARTAHEDGFGAMMGD